MGEDFQPRTIPLHKTNRFTLTVDLGGSLAVASRGLYATGVSTDLNGMWAES